MAAKVFEATVNKKDLNVGGFTNELNDRWAGGWELTHVFEQRGNTVMVWKQRAVG